MLIILRGAPSSGKSTIAKKIRDYDKKITWLKVDNFKPFFDDDNETIIDDVNDMALNSLDYLLDHGFSVVMEGIFQNPRYIQKAVDIAKNKNILSKVYLLDCSLNMLKERDRVREGVKEGCRKPLGDEKIEKLFNFVRSNPYPESIKLNTEELSLDQCVEIIKQNF